MNAEQIDVNNNERIFYSVGPINYLSVAIDIIKIIIILKSIRRAITYVFKTFSTLNISNSHVARTEKA